MFNLTDVKLIVICMVATLLVFMVIYYIVFKITESILQDCGKPDLGVSYEL